MSLGTAIYYIAPRFLGYSPGVSTLVSLDGGEPEWVDLSSAKDEPYSVRWKALGLPYAPHSVYTQTYGIYLHVIRI